MACKPFASLASPSPTGRNVRNERLSSCGCFSLLTDVFLELLTGFSILPLAAVCMSKAEVRCPAIDNDCNFFPPDVQEQETPTTFCLGNPACIIAFFLNCPVNCHQKLDNIAASRFTWFSQRSCLNYSDELDVFNFGYKKLASVVSLQTPQIWHGFTDLRA